MQHFPIYMNLQGQRVVISGGGDAALAKLRLVMKTEAELMGVKNFGMTSLVEIKERLTDMGMGLRTLEG